MAFRARKKKINAVVGEVGDSQLELHERLDEVHLNSLHEKFAGGQVFTEKELMNLLFNVAKIQYEPEFFNDIFQRINTRGDGYVSWDEFISYLIVGFQQKEVSFEFRSLLDPIPTVPKLLKSNHRHPITTVTFYPTVKADRTIGDSGSIVTCSKDGTINFWSIYMQLERTAYSTCPELKVQPTWVTYMVVLPDVRIICTSSSERDLRFYDTSARKFELRVMFTIVDQAITAMFYAFSKNHEEESKLILGDMGGNVHVLFIDVVARGPFKSKPGDPLINVRYDRVIKGLVPGFHVKQFNRLHTDFVRQLSYYPLLSSIVSCAQCQKAALLMTDISQTKDSYVFKIPAGTWCFALEDSVHIIATAGPDCLIRIWNPFVPSRPISILYGHHTGGVALTFQDSGKMLYTMSKDKMIKVWDVQSQQCLQTYTSLPSGLGERTSLTGFYNWLRREWIVASSMLAVVPLNPQPNPKHTDGTTHSEAITVVLYNKLFKVLVTCGVDSFIIVWNPWDGRRMMIIRQAHTQLLYGENVSVEITSAAFDWSWSRLLTAAHDGTLKIWDFCNGICLRNLQVSTMNEIRTVLWMKNRIMASGWNRCITEFSDHGETYSSEGSYGKNWEQLHEADISASAIRIPQTLVTSCFRGELIFWRLETGQPYKKFCVYDPSERIKIQYKTRTKPRLDDDSLTFLKKTSIKKRSVYSHSLRKPTLRRSTLVIDRNTESDTTVKMLAVHCLLFLNSREMDPDIGTLLVGLGNGMVQVWTHASSGGFITSFNAVHKIGDYVVAMATDDKNEYLFTGSIFGYIRAWLMEDYCVKDPEYKACLPKYRIKFPFTWGGKFLGRAQRAVRDQPKPVLLNCYRAHLKPISGLSYLDEAEILISASTDGSARMWTLGGRFIQTVGTFKKWTNLTPGKPIDDPNFPFQPPADLKRIGSSTSLRVYGGGVLPTKLAVKKELFQNKSLSVMEKSKIYGKSLQDPILGNYWNIPEKTAKRRDIEFDTSFPYIPVYQHMIMPQMQPLDRPPTPTTDQNDTKKKL